MPRCARLTVAAALSTLALATLPAFASAAIWTPVASNTAEDITAIEYQGADRFWFTTGNGKIFRRAGGSFVEEQNVPGVVFRDIEFLPAPSETGLAVGTNGAVWRSTDAGATWSSVSAIVPPGGNASGTPDCAATAPLGDVDSVRFDSQGHPWLIAGGSQIYRSTLTGEAGWIQQNDAGTTCRITKDMDDVFFVPGSNPVAGSFVGKSFGAVFFTANGLTSSATEKPADAGNGFTTIRRVAGDPANANRQWTVTPGGGGASYFRLTRDGWSTSESWTIGNSGRRDLTRPADVDVAGGTVLAAGSAGMILHSADGRSFFFDDAAGALATTDWLSVGLASATQGAVGGAGGKLVTTSAANVMPDIAAPTGTISGPARAVAGRPVTYTAVAADTGGSGLNTGSFAWSATGLPNRTGRSVSVTFPAAGVYALGVAFADNAGNVGRATTSVTVSRAAKPKPTIVLKGKGNALTARRKGATVVVRVKGRLNRPAGVSAAQGCTGTVRITVTKGKKKLLARTAKVRKSCRFAKTIRIKRTRVGKASRLGVALRFSGNGATGTRTRRLSVRIKG